MIELLVFVGVIILVVVAIKLGKQDNAPSARPSGLPDGLKMARQRAVESGDTEAVQAIDNGTYKELLDQRAAARESKIATGIEIYQYSIAGINYRKGIAAYIGRSTGYIKPEPTNRHDPNAIAVYAEDGHHLGYIPATDTYELHSLHLSFPIPVTVDIEECYDADGRRFFVGEVTIKIQTKKNKKNMKKILLFLSILPSMLLAQIAPIQTQEKPYEFVVGNMLYRKVATDTYYLQIESDNQFEDKAAILELGNGPTEAMTSLGNLFSLFGKEDSDFSLQGYRFGVRKTYIFAYHVGPLEYSAGEYVLRQTKLALIMKELMEKKDMPLGDVRIVYFDKSAVFIHYDTYQFRDAVNFYNMSLPWSHEYTKGDVVSDDDIRLILKATQNPNAYRSKTAKSGAYVLEKEQLIKVCETILSK